MASVRVVWSDEAFADLTEIHDYIARHSPRYAAIVVPTTGSGGCAATLVASARS